jgi:hypothetical protein
VLVFWAMSTARAFIPRPRRGGIVSQEVDGELLLYVEATHQASSLNASARRIWALCDGVRSVESIAADANLSAGVVVLAVKQFAAAGLLENGPELPRVNISRRRVMIAAGLATPVILMILAPKAAAAASCVGPGPCTLGQFCCSTGNSCAASGGICP